MATKSALMQAESELRRHALGYPEAIEELPWGHRAIKVNGRAFVFMGWSDEVFGLSVKLPVSAKYALSLPFSTPTGYGLGKSGWVSARFNAHDEVPVDMLKEWVDESFRAIAPKGLLAQLPAADYRPRKRISTRPTAKPAPAPAPAPTTKVAAQAAKGTNGAAKPERPAAKTEAKADKAERTTQAPARPATKPSQPALKSTRGDGKQAKPEAKPTQSAAKPAPKETKASRPKPKTSGPVAKPSKPAAKPARPAAKLDRPAAKTARKVAKPARPSAKPTRTAARAAKPAKKRSGR